MTSPHILDQITDYLDNHLVGSTADRVKSHLVFCNACRQAYQDIRSNSALLKLTPYITPSPALMNRLQETMSKDIPTENSKKPSQELAWVRWIYSGRGAALLLAMTLFFLMALTIPRYFGDMEKNGPKEMNTPSSKSTKSIKIPPKINDNQQIAHSNTNTSTVDSPPLAENQWRDPSKLILEENVKVKMDEKKAHEKTKDTDNLSLSGYSSGITQPLEKVISDRKTWEDYWSRHQKNQSPSPTPDINFDKNDVILIFGGTQPTSGFHIEITRLIVTQWENAPARVVRYELITPPANVVVNTILTQPYVMKIVPKLNGPTFFKKIR